MSWIETAYRDTLAWDHLEFLVDVGNGRMAGSEQERRAAEGTRDKLTDIGARNARLDEFEITGWDRNSSHIEAADGRSYECFALPRSPSETAAGKLVDLEWGLPEDFEAADVEGKVVIASTNVPDGYPRIVHRLEKYALAVTHGAAAFVLRNHRDGELIRSGTIRGANGEPIGQIPTVGVSFECGNRISRRHEGEKLTVGVDADIGPVTSQNVHAELGPDTEEEIIVSCHVDGHDISESAGDNAAGTATIVGVAKALADREGELETRIHFIGFGAEEVGLLGSEYHARKTDLENIRVMIQNDGVARARNLVMNTNGWEELLSPVEAVSESFDQPVVATTDLVLGSDHWRFVDRGVPAYAVASESPDPGAARAYGSSSGIVITPADTLDKIDPRDLRAHVILETELIVDLSQSDAKIPHVDPEAIDELVEETNEVITRDSLAISGDPPW